MAARSKVVRLPPAVRNELERKFRERRFTLDELMEFIRSRDGDVSRSGLGRYLHNYEHQLKRYREAQDIAGVWAQKLGEEPRGDVGRLCMQMLQMLAQQTMAAMGEKDSALDPQDLMLLARAVRDFTSAEKTSADRELKVRKELAAKVEKKVDELKAKRIVDPAVIEQVKELMRGALG